MLFGRRNKPDPAFPMLSRERAARFRELLQHHFAADGWQLEFDPNQPTVWMSKGGLNKHIDFSAAAERFSQATSAEQEDNWVRIVQQRCAAMVENSLHYRVLHTFRLEQQMAERGHGFSESSFEISQALSAVLCDGVGQEVRLLNDAAVAERYGNVDVHDKARVNTQALLDDATFAMQRVDVDPDRNSFYLHFTDTTRMLPSTLIAPLSLDPYFTHADAEPDWDEGVLIAVPNYSTLLCVPVIPDDRMRVLGKHMAHHARDMYDASDADLLSPVVFHVSAHGRVEPAFGFYKDPDSGKLTYEESPEMVRRYQTHNPYLSPQPGFDKDGLPTPDPLYRGHTADTAFARLTKDQANRMLFDFTGYLGAHGWQASFSHTEPLMWATQDGKSQRFELTNVAEEFSQLTSRQAEMDLVQAVTTALLGGIPGERTLTHDRMFHNSALHYQVLPLEQLDQAAHSRTATEVAPGMFRVLCDAPISQSRTVTDERLAAEYNDFDFHDQAHKNTADYLSELEIKADYDDGKHTTLRSPHPALSLSSILALPGILHPLLWEPDWDLGIIVAVPSATTVICGEIHAPDEAQDVIAEVTRRAQDIFAEAEDKFSPRVFRILDNGSVVDTT